MKIKSAISILVTLCAVLGASAQNRNFEMMKNLEIYNSVFKEIELFYVDTIDIKASVGRSINAMLDNLDPYTKYYEDEDEELKMMITGKYAGVGAVIRYVRKKNCCIVAEPYEDMPAAKAGLKAGDVIVAIDGESTKGMKVEEVSKRLKGTTGTTVVVKVERPGQNKPMAFKITRQPIQTPVIAYYGMLTDDIGYLDYSQFTENSARDLRNAFISLRQKGMKKFILDLRSNGGGSLDEAVELLSMFINKGETVVETKGKIKQANRTYKTTTDPIAFDMPLVVLVGSATASASEITSGTLQDLDRAVIIGGRTYGKGLVQNVRPVPYGGNVKVTTSKYYIPSGRCIQAIDYKNRNEDGSVGRIPDSLTNVFYTRAGRMVRDGGGITPDITVEGDSVPNMLYYLMESDEIIDYATQYCLKHPTIAPARDYVMTDDEYEDFKAYIEKSDFKYDRHSKGVLDELRKMAEFEGYLEEAKDEFAALEKKLSHNIGHDLDHFKTLVKPLVENEITKRYYYQKGAIIQSLRYDKCIDKAKEVLNSEETYHSILSNK